MTVTTFGIILLPHHPPSIYPHPPTNHPTYQLIAEEALATALTHHTHLATTTTHTIADLHAKATHTATQLTLLQTENASLKEALQGAEEREKVARSQEKMGKDGYHRKIVQLEAQLGVMRKECGMREEAINR